MIALRAREEGGRRAVAIGAAAALPPLLLDGTWNAVLSLALIYSLMGLSVVVLTGFVGQLSLMPASFVGLGAYVSGRLVTGLDTPFWGAAPLAAAHRRSRGARYRDGRPPAPRPLPGDHDARLRERHRGVRVQPGSGSSVPSVSSKRRGRARRDRLLLRQGLLRAGLHARRDSCFLPCGTWLAAGRHVRATRYATTRTPRTRGASTSRSTSCSPSRSPALSPDSPERCTAIGSRPSRPADSVRCSGWSSRSRSSSSRSSAGCARSGGR